MLLCTAVAVIMALAVVTVEARKNEYISLGFWRTIFLETRDQTAQKLAIGAALIAGLLLFRLLWSFLTSRLSRASQFFRNLSSSVWPYIICLSCALFVLVVHVFIYGVNGKSGTFFIAVFACLWCFVFRYCRKRPNDPARSRWFQSKAFLADFCAASAFFVLIAPFLDKFPVKLFLHPEVLAATLVSTLLGLFALIYCFIPFYVREASAQGSQTLGRGAILVTLFMLIVSVLPAVCWGISGHVLTTSVQPDRPWNVMIIGIDALRWDRTCLLGRSDKNRDLTPNLRKLAARGTIFDRAVSQAPWTLPAFCSVLTGKYPFEHGAFSPYGFLRDKEVTLAEIMREAGYTTGAVTSCHYVSSKRGLGQGFDYFDDDNMAGPLGITSEKVTNETIKFLDECGNRRFFAFVHYYDPHALYMNHKQLPYADKYSGWLRDELYTLHNLWFKRHSLESNDIEHLKDLYDEEVAYTDKQIGRLLDYMKQRQLDRNTVFVVLADHGEEFMERGWVGHTISLHAELIHVPLFIVIPGNERKTTVVGSTVETRAVFSTVLECIGLSCNLKPLPQSLLSLMQDSGEQNTLEPLSNHAYSSVWIAKKESRLRNKLLSVQTDRWKLIVDYISQKEFLFDLQRDPLEKENLASKKPLILGELRGKLDAWHVQTTRGAVAARTSDLSQKEIERLKSLGYL